MSNNYQLLYQPRHTYSPPSQVGYDGGAIPAFYVINPDGSIVPMDFGFGPDGFSNAGYPGFFGYPVAEEEGLPHGPLSLRYWMLTRTYTGPPDSGYVDTLSDTIVVDCDPQFVFDAISGDPCVSLYEIAVPGTADDGDGNYSMVRFLSGTSVEGNYGAWTILNGYGRFPYNTPKFGNNLFPAFDMGDVWYQQMDFVSIVNGATAQDYTVTFGTNPLYFASVGIVNQPFWSGEYEPQSGYTLTAQSGTERVWSRPRQDGVPGTDTITITLSVVVSDPSPTSWGAGFECFDLGQVWVIGLDNQGEVGALELQHSYLNEDDETEIDTTYLSSVGQMLVLYPDGTMGFEEVSISSGSGSGTVSSAGNIVLGVGNWSNPTAEYSLDVDLFATV